MYKAGAPNYVMETCAAEINALRFCSRGSNGKGVEVSSGMESHGVGVNGAGSRVALKQRVEAQDKNYCDRADAGLYHGPGAEGLRYGHAKIFFHKPEAPIVHVGEQQ